MHTSRTEPRITICGISELGEHSAAGVTHVLSILGPNAPDHLRLPRSRRTGGWSCASVM